MKIDKRKLKNNVDLPKKLSELKDSIDPEDKDYCYKKVDTDISIIIMPNKKIIHNIRNKKRADYFKKYSDYTINIYWKQVEIGSYSQFQRCLYIDRVLKSETLFIENVINVVRPYIPDKDYVIDCGVYYVDWDNRPFITLVNQHELKIRKRRRNRL